MSVRLKQIVLSLLVLIFTLTFSPVFAQEDLTENYTSTDGSITLNYPAGWVVTEQDGQVLGGTSQAAIDAANNQEALAADQAVFAFFSAFSADELQVSPDATPLEVLASPAFGELSGAEERTVNDVSVAFVTFSPEDAAGGPNLFVVRAVDRGLFLVMVGLTAPESVETHLPTLLGILASVSYVPPPPSGGIAVEIPADQIPVPVAGEGDVVWQIDVEDDDPFSGLSLSELAVDAQDNIYVQIPVDGFAEIPEDDDWTGLMVLNADGIFQRAFYNEEVNMGFGSNDLAISSDGTFWMESGGFDAIRLVHLDSNGNLMHENTIVKEGYSVDGMRANVVGADGYHYVQVDFDPIDIVAPDGSHLGNLSYEGRLLAGSNGGFLFFMGAESNTVVGVDFEGNPTALSITLPDGAEVEGVAAGASVIYIAGSNGVIYQFDNSGNLSGSFAFPPEENFSVQGMAVLSDGDLVINADDKLTRLRISGGE